jgi:hypothetical protein
MPYSSTTRMSGNLEILALLAITASDRLEFVPSPFSRAYKENHPMNIFDLRFDILRNK